MAQQQNPADAIRILKNSSLGGFDPVQLASLRADQLRGHRTQAANLAGADDPTMRNERQRQQELGDLVTDDIADDPFTGTEEAARIGKIDDTNDAVTSYNRPDVTKQREDTERLKRLLAGEPARVSGLAARDVAQITADATKSKAAAEGWAEPTVGLPDPYGSGAQYPVPRRIAADPVAARKFIDQYRAQGIGGQQGQADRSTINGMNSLIDVLGETWRQGEAIGWKGLGPIAGNLGGPLFRMTGSSLFSNPAEEALRNQIGRVKAREAFGEGGKAFTGTEEELVDAFISATADNPSATRTRLSQSMQHAAVQLINRGVPREVVEQKIQAALGGAADVDLMRSIFGPLGSAPNDRGVGVGGGADVISDPNWGAGAQ